MEYHSLKPTSVRKSECDTPGHSVAANLNSSPRAVNDTRNDQTEQGRRFAHRDTQAHQR